MKLVLEINVKAGHEDIVLAKVKEIYNNPFISKIEQLSDYYVFLDFKEDLAEKALKIQELKGVIDIKMTPVLETVLSKNMTDSQNVFIVFIDVERGSETLVMKYFETNKTPLYKVCNAGYIFDYRGDIILEISSSEGLDKIIPEIRSIENVRDTIFYNLPRVKSN